MPAIPKRHDIELTGRARVRAGWFGRLLLQVEEQVTTYSACPPMPGRDPKAWRELMRSEGMQTLRWRDASWDDMQALHRLDLVPAGRIEPRQPWPRGQVPPLQSPPIPVPPMADTTYGCNEHYYDGCPNCGRGKRRWPGQPDPDLRR